MMFSHPGYTTIHNYASVLLLHVRFVRWITRNVLRHNYVSLIVWSCHVIGRYRSVYLSQYFMDRFTAEFNSYISHTAMWIILAEWSAFGQSAPIQTWNLQAFSGQEIYMHNSSERPDIERMSIINAHLQIRVNFNFVFCLLFKNKWGDFWVRHDWVFCFFH